MSEKFEQIERLRITTNNLKNDRMILIYPVLLWLSFFPIFILFLSFFEFYFQRFTPILVFFVLPPLFLLYFSSFVLLLLFFSKLLLIFANLLRNPREGIFQRSSSDFDYTFFCFRKTVKELVFRAFNKFPLPWAKVLAFKVCNIIVPTSTGVLDSYIDSDFVSFGKETILGEGSNIMSSMIYGDYLIVKKVIVGDYCTVGAYSIVSPGTVIEKESILGMGSYTCMNQRIESGWIYAGRPAKKLKKIEK